VLEADHALRRGIRRGAYVLAIRVTETNAGFFAADVALLNIDPELAYALGYSLRGSHSTRESGTAGFRLFLGPRGVLFGAVRDQDLQAGYTRYGLFGGRGSASLALSYGPNTCCSRGEILPLGLDPSFASWSLGERRRASFAADLPLSGNYALRLAATELRARTGLRLQVLDDPFRSATSFADEAFIRRDVELKWIFDDRDDPLFPSRGSALSAGPELAESSTPERRPGTSGAFPVPPADVRSHARMAALAAAGTRSWPLTPRQAFSVGGRIALGRSEVKGLATAGGLDEGARDLGTREASVEVRHSWSLWGPERTRRAGDLRLETSASYGYESTWPSLSFAGNPVRRLAMGSSVVFRNGWGIFRLGFTYLDLRGER
jgi:hypothetical protein